MGIRGEIFSTTVALQNRTYFFNVKENRMGDLYLNIVESKNRETGGFERQSVIFFADDLKEILAGFDESLRVMEKAVREKRKSSNFRSKPAAGRSEGESSRSEGSRRPGKAVIRKKPASDRFDRERPPQKTRRRVVKKKED